MSVNGITNVAQTFDTKSASKAKTSDSVNETKQKEVEEAAIYEKSETQVTKNKVYQRDDNKINRLLAEADKRTQQLRDLVQKLLLKQGETFSDATDIYQLLREGKVEVDPETRVQAQKDIAAEGYWGVEQTSDRLVSFAKALTGGDTSKANEMIEAVKKGFEEATKAWGGDLPSISKETMDSAIKKMEAWRDGKETAN